ncbi:MAG: RNA polymerase sigma factor [Prevotella sp.]|jgi:RNA polymerase sigma-70 factor (ECF subfamily)|nr:RNA polymerase sigma factor [Prevotella sp.]
MDEKLKIKSILQGNINDFSFFVENYQDMALTLACRICNNRQDAEDIVQEAFIKAFRNLRSFRLGSKFSTWFYRIVYNTACTYIRSSFYTADFTDASEAEKESVDWDVVEKIDADRKRELINLALAKLPPHCAAVLTLFYMEEQTVKDIAVIAGMTESNVKVVLHRGRKQLAELLKTIAHYE